MNEILWLSRKDKMEFYVVPVFEEDKSTIFGHSIIFLKSLYSYEFGKKSLSFKIIFLSSFKLTELNNELILA